MFATASLSVEDVLEEYPSLKREDVHACLDYPVTNAAFP
jgi:uncharacterized protein (DUF433 family)